MSYSDPECLCGRRALMDSGLCQECEDRIDFEARERYEAEAEDVRAREAGL